MTLCVSSVGCHTAGWPVSPRARRESKDVRGQGALNADHLAPGGGLVSSLAAFVPCEQLGLNLGGDK